MVVTEQGKLQANVEVTVAVIDGLFKEKIKATEHFPPGSARDGKLSN